MTAMIRRRNDTPALWPRLATVRFANRLEPVIILGIHADEYIVLDRTGDTRLVPLFRVRLAERPLRDLWELIA